MSRETKIHDKAIRLIEGGIVEVDNHWVKMIHRADICDPCYICELDSICYQGTAIYDLCLECDIITGADCSLVLMDKK